MANQVSGNSQPLYLERLQSPKTGALFAGLALVFLVLFLLRQAAGRFGAWSRIFLALTGMFAFYALNYRILEICLTPAGMKLKFGIFTWTIPMENIAAFFSDGISGVKKYGGAGIHFMSYGGRYRASFNFLEHPRLLISLKNKAGPVQEISFSTRQPETLLKLLTGLVQPAGRGQPSGEAA